MSALAIFLCSLFWGKSTDNPSPTLASLGFVLYLYCSYVRAMIPGSEALPLQGNHKEGMVLTSDVAPPYQQRKTKWGMRNRKAPFASQQSHRSLAGAFKNIWKNAAFNSENIHRLTTRTLPLNFKTLPGPKDQRVSRVNLASWFLRTFPVNWLFSSCIWLPYFFFFLCDLKKGLNWNARSLYCRYSEAFTEEPSDTDLTSSPFLWLRKTKVWKKRKVTSISFPAYSPVRYNPGQHF